MTYSYTASGRLGGYRNPNAGMVATATYEYDASGQRYRSVVPSGTGSTATTTTYQYDGLTLLSLSATSAVAGTSTPTTWSLAYLYDETGRPYAGVHSQGATTTPFAIVTSDRGDVLGLLDKDGQCFATYAYDAWGNPLSATTSATVAVPNPGAIASRQVLRYAGYVWDEESQTYYCSARQYDPATGQFLTKDPADADGEESAFQYCGGEPVGKVDASGRWSRRSTLNAEGIAVTYDMYVNYSYNAATKRLVVTGGVGWDEDWGAGASSFYVDGTLRFRRSSGDSWRTPAPDKTDAVRASHKYWVTGRIVYDRLWVYCFKTRIVLMVLGDPSYNLADAYTHTQYNPFGSKRPRR